MEIEPIWVGDASTVAWDIWRDEHPDRYEELMVWAESQGIRTGDTTRIEVYLIDGPSAVVTTYARDERGRIVVDATGENALRRTKEIPLSSLPPVIEGRS